MTRDEIRAWFRDRAGRGTVKGLYQHALDDRLRAVSESLEYLIQRGELVEEPGGGYRLVEMRKGTGRKSARTPALWRGVHQLSLRGDWSTADLAQVAGSHPRSARMYVAGMIALGHVVQASPGRYRVAKGAPHRDSPPEYTWPSGDKKYRKKGLKS